MNDRIPAEDILPASHGMTRRKWIKKLIGAAAIGLPAVGLYAGCIEPYWVEVVNRTMPIRNLPASLEGKTLVQISDIHIGERVDDGFLVSWFRRIADWQPDLVVFTGDFLTLNSDRTLPAEQMKRVLTEFPHGKLATLGILGNHDYGIHFSEMEAAEVVEQIANNAGIKILRNTSRIESGLQFIGFDDYMGPNFRNGTFFKDVDLTRPSLVLCHNPDVADLRIWRDYGGWILAGHTHGGQFKPPFFTPPVLPIRNAKYAAGEIALDNGRRLYVNRALGHSFCVRMNVRPEITVFQLTADQTT